MSVRSWIDSRPGINHSRQTQENQHGWTRLAGHNQISVDFEDENSPDQQYFMRHFRINIVDIKRLTSVGARPAGDTVSS